MSIKWWGFTHKLAGVMGFPWSEVWEARWSFKASAMVETFEQEREETECKGGSEMRLKQALGWCEYSRGRWEIWYLKCAPTLDEKKQTNGWICKRLAATTEKERKKGFADARDEAQQANRELRAKPKPPEEIKMGHAAKDKRTKAIEWKTQQSAQDYS